MSTPYLILEKNDECRDYFVTVTNCAIKAQTAIERNRKAIEDDLPFECLVYALDALPQVMNIEIEVNESRRTPVQDEDV